MVRGNQNGNGGNSSDGFDVNVGGDSQTAVRFDGGGPDDSGNAGAGTENSGNAGGGSQNSGSTGGGSRDGGNTGDTAEEAGGDDLERVTDGGNEESTGPETDDVNEHRIFHRKVMPVAEEANQSLLRLVANLERCEVTDLPPLYDQIDHMVEHLFTDPPPADAQAKLEFSYHGYRIELDQSGDVKFMRINGEEPAASEE